MKQLIYQELKIQNKIYNITKYSFMFFVICCFSVTLVNSYENIQIFGIMFAVISIPLAFINLSSYLVKPDLEDGTFELLLASYAPSRIILAKYIALCLNCFVSFCLTIPLLYVIYNLKLSALYIMIASASILLLLSASLVILIAAIQAYFRSNTNFLSILVLPLLTPNIIFSGILVQNSDRLYLLFIMIGINLTIIPPALYLSRYLVKNIYNI